MIIASHIPIDHASAENCTMQLPPRIRAVLQMVGRINKQQLILTGKDSSSVMSGYQSQSSASRNCLVKSSSEHEAASQENDMGSKRQPCERASTGNKPQWPSEVEGLRGWEDPCKRGRKMDKQKKTMMSETDAMMLMTT